MDTTLCSDWWNLNQPSFVVNQVTRFFCCKYTIDIIVVTYRIKYVAILRTYFPITTIKSYLRISNRQFILERIHTSVYTKSYTPRLVAMYLRKWLEPNTSLALYSPVHSQAYTLYLVKGAQNLCAYTYHVHSYAILHSNVLILPVHVT